MVIKTSHFIILVTLIAVGSQGENMRKIAQTNSEIKSQQQDFNDRIKRNHIEASEFEKLSKVALSRYKNNCIFVVDGETKKDSFFQPNALVVDAKLNRSVRPGADICNKSGDTAKVSEGGTITDIARVSVPDLPTFKKLIQARS